MSNVILLNKHCYTVDNACNQGNSPLPLTESLRLAPARSPTLAVELPGPRQLTSPLHHRLVHATVSRAKISPKPSITPLMNGKMRLIPRTALILRRDRWVGMVNNDNVSEGGCSGGEDEGLGWRCDGSGELDCSPVASSDFERPAGVMPVGTGSVASRTAAEVE
jgi:hypothetical protein